MNDWTKADGARIEITFDQPLLGIAPGAESSFSVTAPEYTYVPGGELVAVPKTVARVENRAGTAVRVDLSAGDLAGVSWGIRGLRLAVDHG